MGVLSKKTDLDEFLVCEGCAVSHSDDDSVQKRLCGCILCEDCMPCQAHDDDDLDDESDFFDEDDEDWDDDDLDDDD
jgi:hypothetical protein